jgi:histidinol-phosphatase
VTSGPADDGLLRFATGLVRDAGRLAAARFAEGSTARDKEDGTEVAPADVEVEEFLRARISERFPDDAVHGEEAGERAGTSGRRWVLDPINGTSLFVRRVPTWNVLLAVEDAGGPAVGVIAHPVIDEVLFAGRGLGCWRQRGDAAPERVRVSGTARRRGATVELVNPVTWSEELLVALHREVFVLPAMKGAADVATGISDAVVVAGFPMGYEDLAPLPVIIGEAGGRVTDLHGGDVLSGDGSALISNGVLHDGLLDLVAGIRHGREFRALLEDPAAN